MWLVEAEGIGRKEWLDVTHLSLISEYERRLIRVFVYDG